jgi:predicted DNA-binding mobile mystery protein A
MRDRRLCIGMNHYNLPDMPDRSARQQARLLQLDELVAKIKPSASEWRVPDGGWIACIRDALGMSGDQLGDRLGITRSSVRALELRERDGGATLEALRAVASVLGCDVVYALIPKAGSFAATLRTQAELADAGRLETETTAGDREESIRDLMHRRPRVLWGPACVRHPNAAAPHRKGLKPGPPRGRRTGSRASGTIPSIAPAPGAENAGSSGIGEAFLGVRGGVLGARDEIRAAPGAPVVPDVSREQSLDAWGTLKRSEPANVPVAPDPSSPPVVEDVAPKATRHHPRGGRRAADVEQLDVFG